MKNEPHFKKISCPYCGDAPINHAFSFVGGWMEIAMDKNSPRFTKHVPSFLASFADSVLGFFFEVLAFIKIAKFSSDIERTNTFRSRIIWEEGRRRGIHMEQVIFFNQPLDYYRGYVNNKTIYFKSIPIRPEFSDMKESWDDKVILKQVLSKNKIPVPACFELSAFFGIKNKDKIIQEIFSKLEKPIIVKPRIGSRGRHTVTNIKTLEQFRAGINIASKICPYLVVEEHLVGSVCRATFVGGALAGFYQAQAPSIVGNGKKSVRELIEEKDRGRHERVERINISQELEDHIARSGFKLADVLPEGVTLSLTHRMGRLFGGTTKEMIDDLHPSFIPILENAAKIVGLPVIGFDCIVPDPTKEAQSQKWGIIECNTLPFIDLHYYALEGKPRNIAGMIWDLWK